VNRRYALAAVRHGLPALIAVLSLGVLLINDDPGVGLEIAAMGLGGAVSVWLVGWFLRISVTDSSDRAREEAARDFFDRHGRWPTRAERERLLDEPEPEPKREPPRHRPAPARARSRR
jgi:hypothetical protein